MTRNGKTRSKLFRDSRGSSAAGRARYWAGEQYNLTAEYCKELGQQIGDSTYDGVEFRPRPPAYVVQFEMRAALVSLVAIAKHYSEGMGETDLQAIAEAERVLGM